MPTYKFYSENELLSQQLRLEEESLNICSAEFFNRRAKAIASGSETTTDPISEVFNRCIDPFAALIKEKMDEAMTGGAGRKNEAVRVMQHFSHLELAYLSARCIMDNVASSRKAASVSNAIGQELQTFHMLRDFRQEFPGLTVSILRSQDEAHATAMNKRKALKRSATFHMADYHKWDKKRMASLGEVLLRWFMESSGLVEFLGKRSRAGRLEQYVCASPELLKWIKKSEAIAAVFAPKFMPMVCKPQEWTNPYDGGYLRLNPYYSLVRTGQAQYKQELISTDMPQVYKAVNAIQETPWQINLDVLYVAHYIWENLDARAKLPSRAGYQEPAKPAGYCSDFTEEAFTTWKNLNKEAWEQWRKASALEKSKAIQNKSKAISASTTLWMAKKLRSYERIYFPHNLDWRGRIYPLVSYLTPQGSQLAKALLRFADGQPLGERGAYWLKVHLANTYGVDKVSFDDRQQWVAEHEDLILATATHPLDHLTWWEKADSPFCFLAACLEYAGYKREGVSFKSKLPIALDGSCNGLQNFSALLLDSKGAAATNLIPSEKPNDIYKDVADECERILLERNDAWAEFWRGRVTRSIVKTNVMTTPYSVTRIGMIEQIIEAAQKNDSIDVEGGDLHEAATYLSAVVYEAIGSVVVAARQAMDWLQSVAKVMAKQNIPVHWHTPIGFPVNQAYFKTEEDTIDTVICKIRIRRRFIKDSTTISCRKMASGISPNFIHSLDASHLMMTVSACLEQSNIRHFAMIHDSYGTHACNTDELSKLLRESFINQYGQEVIREFYEELCEQVPEGIDLPPPPPIGDFDLERVLDAPYFFA